MLVQDMNHGMHGTLTEMFGDFRGKSVGYFLYSLTLSHALFRVFVCVFRGKSVGASKLPRKSCTLCWLLRRLKRLTSVNHGMH